MNIEIIDLSTAQHRNIFIPIQHCSEQMWNENKQGKWAETENNYRLNTCDEVYFAVIGNVAIGHLGINEDSIRAVYIDPEYRGLKLSYQLYEHVFLVLGEIKSDTAREKVADKIWKKLHKKYSALIKYDTEEDIYIFNRNNFDAKS